MPTIPTVGPTNFSPLPSTAPQAEPLGPTPDILPGTQSLMVSGDAGAMIAALAVESGRSQKKAALEQRHNAEANEASEQSAQIQALREKADLVRVQGFVDGAMTLGTAALDFASSMSSISAESDKNASKGIGSELGDQSPMNRAAGATQVALFDARAKRESTSAAGFKAGSDFNKGAQGIVDGLFKGAIADKDTDAEVHSQLATRAKRAVEDATGDYEDAKKLLEKALDFYKEYTGAKNGAVSAAIHRA